MSNHDVAVAVLSAIAILGGIARCAMYFAWGL